MWFTLLGIAYSGTPTSDQLMGLDEAGEIDGIWVFEWTPRR
jgi:hypothetical protein